MGTLIGKSIQLIGTMIRNIITGKEKNRWLSEKSKKIGRTCYILCYIGKDTQKSETGIAIEKY